MYFFFRLRLNLCFDQFLCVCVSVVDFIAVSEYQISRIPNLAGYRISTRLPGRILNIQPQISDRSGKAQIRSDIRCIPTIQRLRLNLCFDWFLCVCVAVVDFIDVYLQIGYLRPRFSSPLSDPGLGYLSAWLDGRHRLRAYSTVGRNHQ